MSGSGIPVYSTSTIEEDIKIGTINHKERFAVTQNGPIAIEIMFVNSSGNWVKGRLDLDANINDWCDYLFDQGALPSDFFRTDTSVKMYNSGGVLQKTYPAGTRIIPYTTNSSQNGTNHPDYLRIRDLYDQYGNQISDSTYGMFIDCRIRYDSGDTPVYGDWN